MEQNLLAQHKRRMENITVGDYVLATGGGSKGLRGVVQCVTPSYIKFQAEDGFGITQVSKKYVRELVIEQTQKERMENISVGDYVEATGGSWEGL
jgi:preprotein translocase subunit YajC